MNILFVWTSPFKNAGGVGRVTATLAREFKRKGHGVWYFSFSNGDTYTDEDVIQYFSPDHLRVLSAQNIGKLEGILQKHEIDVVINQAGITNTDVLDAITRAVSQSNNNSIKVYSVHHNCIKCLYDHFELTLKENYRKNRLYPFVANPLSAKLLKFKHKYKYRKVFNYLIENSDRLVLLSDAFVPDLKTYLRSVPENSVVGISNPAPFEVMDTEEKKENRLLFVGRIDFHQKRADLLIALWKKLYETHQDWSFDIVGDGDTLNELKDMAAAANLDRIYFHGFSEPAKYLEKAKFFTMTSAFEGFGMVLVEAQAYGVVPFAFDSFNSLSEIISDGINGMKIPAYDVDRYAERLSNMMENDEKRREFAKNGQRTVEKFSPSKIAKQWEQLFMS